MPDPDLCSDCDKDELIHKMTMAIMNDDSAMTKIRRKITKLGPPLLITFTFGKPHAKKVSIDFDTYRDAMARGMNVDDGENQKAATDLLSGAFTYATVLNTVTKRMENE